MSENDPDAEVGTPARTIVPAATVSFTYSAAEDRIIGVLGQGEAGVRVLLTRRLVRRIIERLAQLLERSSPMAGRAPAAMRADVVQIEHQSALAQLTTGSGAAATTAPGAAAARRAPALLVTHVNLTPQGNGFVLALGDAAGRKVKLRVLWQDLHRLVGALHQQARNAQWDLADAAPWLAPAAGSTVTTA